VSADSPDLAQTKQLLDGLKRAGFHFRRTAPGEDGPLLGQRVSESWVDLIYLEGFSHDCYACRQRRSPLIIPGLGAVDRQICGSALDVLGMKSRPGTHHPGVAREIHPNLVSLSWGQRSTDTEAILII
jgi:hypothetical protein